MFYNAQVITFDHTYPNLLYKIDLVADAKAVTTIYLIRYVSQYAFVYKAFWEFWQYLDLPEQSLKNSYLLKHEFGLVFGYKMRINGFENRYLFASVLKLFSGYLPSCIPH